MTRSAEPQSAEPVAQALAKLEAVLCDPEGRACIHGSDGDLREIDEALALLRSAPPDAAARIAELEQQLSDYQMAAQHPGDGERHRGTSTATQLVHCQHMREKAERERDEARITAEQVEELKRLADEYAEWSAAHAETFDSEYEGPYSRKESLAAEKAAQAALHAALDALLAKHKGE